MMTFATKTSENPRRSEKKETPEGETSEMPQEVVSTTPGVPTVDIGDDLKFSAFSRTSRATASAAPTTNAGPQSLAAVVPVVLGVASADRGEVRGAEREEVVTDSSNEKTESHRIVVPID